MKPLLLSSLFYLFFAFGRPLPPDDQRPRVVLVSPDSSAVGVSPCAALTAYASVPTNGGIDNRTITPASVKLYQVSGTANPVEVPARVNGTGGGDAIILTPQSSLLPNTTYRFVVTDGVKSAAGFPFYPRATVFTTGSYQSGPTLPVSFEKVRLAGTGGEQYTSLAIGPDRKLYALRIDGTLKRFPLLADGTLGAPQTVSTLRNKYGPRMAVGLAVDPASTAAAPTVWVSHCSDRQLDEAPRFEGKISRLTGVNLETETLILDNLPRSRKDHLVNSVAFRPGEPEVLYISQGGNSATGSLDSTWEREESLLSAAVLKLDLRKLPATLPLDVTTTDRPDVINGAPADNYRMPDGTYNPYAGNSPLTIYASGVRNAFDLVWHSNGSLYVPTNGSNFDGTTPGSVPGTRRPDGTLYGGPPVPASAHVSKQRDWLFRIDPKRRVNGKDYHGYYGHPNALRGEYVLNRGYADNGQYPAGQSADANYAGAAYDFGYNKSPNGAIEYKSNTFNGSLKGKLLVCRYSNHDDIIVLEPGADGNVAADKAYTDCVNGIPGLGGFTDPLDVVEDLLTGNLYVSEFSETKSALAQISLCRVPPARLRVQNLDGFPAADEVTFSKIQNRDSRPGTPTNENHDAVTVRLRNQGMGVLRIDALRLSNPAFFRVEGLNGKPYNPSALPLRVPSGGYADVLVKFIATNPPGNNGRVKVLHETLVVASSDAAQPTDTVMLHGLWQKGFEGNNEPYAGEIVEAFGFRTQLGFRHINNKHDAPLPDSDEIFASYFVRADPARPVTVRQMAAYHGCCADQEFIRWDAKAGYAGGGVLLRHAAVDGQSLLPRRNDQAGSPGRGSFNPNVPFSLRISGDCTDPQRNGYAGTVVVKGVTYPMRGARVWKARDSRGNFIPDAYLVSHDYLSDEANLDYNDNVYFVSNLRPEAGPNSVSPLAAAPSALDFGERAVLSTPSLPLTLTSLGKGNDPGIAITAVRIVGPNADEFAVRLPNGATLPPGGAVSVPVQFVPKSAGLKNAALLVTYNNALSPYRVPLYGMATDPCNRIEPVLRLKSAADADVTIAGKPWKADQPYRVGNFMLDNLEDRTSAVGGTDEDELYRTYMSSGEDLDVLGYAIPKLAAGKYLVRMHFAENYFGTGRDGYQGGPGSRVFSVALEGTTRLANLDISGEVGPKFALVSDFEVDVTDGLLNAQFAPTTNRLAISALELYRLISTTTMTFAVKQADPVCGVKTGGTASVANLKGGTPPYAYRWSGSLTLTGPEATGLPPGEQSVTVTDAQGCTRTEKFAVTENPYCAGFRVNAGGAPYVTADSLSFIADTYNTGGAPANPVAGEVAGTPDDYLYQTGRRGNSFSYQFPTGNGTFRVTLHFSELHWGHLAAGGAGSRKFNVDIEGGRKLTDYDIFAKAGGAMHAVRETFEVPVTDSTLNLLFEKGGADVPLVSAIEVVPVLPDGRGPVGGAVLYPNPAQRELFLRVPAAALPVQLALYDVVGKALSMFPPRRVDEGKLAVDVSTLRKGTYLLHVRSREGTQVFKFVKL